MVTVKLGNWSLGFGSEKNRDSKRPFVLVILDGWGHSDSAQGNAIAMANTPNFDRITSKYPGTLLAAAGSRVGLTPNSPGNPEIGHLNIGSGRAVKSNRVRVHEAIADGSFFENQVLKSAFETALKRGSAVHLIGLLSDGDVHSSTETLFSLLRMAKRKGFKDNVFLHGFLDGVDVPQRSADIYVEAIEIKLVDIGVGRIATLCGRQFGMDDTRNWQRTARAYTLLAHSEGIATDDPVSAVRESFLRGLNDEFVQPIVVNGSDGRPIGAIKDGDIAIFFNHRGEQMKQLVRAVVESETASSTFKKPKVDVVCMTDYDPELSEYAAFRGQGEKNVLADVFADHGIQNGRFTGHERSRHLSYFFNGREGFERACEHRIIVENPDFHEIDKPEMASFKVTDKLLRSIEANTEDVYIVNLSAADFAARTGNLEKTIQAVQYIDVCLGGIVDKVRELGGLSIVTADHGNCEDMSLNGSAPTPFTSNPVPFFMVSDHLNGLKLRNDGALEDIAPTILALFGISKPKEMTGSDLRIS